MIELSHEFSKYINMKCYIYQIQNTINQKRYIGLTAKDLHKRWTAHRNMAKAKPNRVLYDAINKYGIDNFIFEVLETFEDISFDELLTKEVEYIKKYNSFTPGGYNMTLGGEGTIGHKLSEESRRKMSESRTGKKRQPFSEEHKVKIGLAHKGKKISEAHKDIISQKFSGKGNPMYGKTFTEEHRQKMTLTKSQKILGYLKSPKGETIEIRNITQFCKANNLCIPGIAKLLKGKHKSYSNWTKL